MSLGGPGDSSLLPGELKKPWPEQPVHYHGQNICLSSRNVHSTTEAPNLPLLACLASPGKKPVGFLSICEL